MTTPEAKNSDADQLPETVLIAQLLADLMPAPPEAPKLSTPPKPVVKAPAAAFVQPALALEDLEPSFDQLPPIPPAPAPTFLPQSAPPAPERDMPAPPAPPPLPKRVRPRSDESEGVPRSVPIRKLSTDLEKPAIPSVVPAQPPPLPVAAVVVETPAPTSAERIPLGDLTVAGFFSLVNWRNDPANVRHAPAAPRFDARTTAELRKIPFILLDAPPVDDSWSVAAVLKTFAW